MTALSLTTATLEQLSSVAVVVAAAADVRALTALSIVAVVLARDDPSPPLAGLFVLICQPTGSACVSDTSYCVLVSSRDFLHDCMDGDGPRPHRHEKDG